jgi:hypothetical protein
VFLSGNFLLLFFDNLLFMKKARFYLNVLQVILIIPVVYQRAQLKHLVSLLLLHMGFAACFPLQAVTLLFS